MNSSKSLILTSTPVAMLSLLLFTACDKSPTEATTARAASGSNVSRQQSESKHGRGGATGPIGPQTSPVAPTLDKGWCGGHGVPESVCTRCNGSLIPQFKEAGDWCAEHGLPESQCELCNPGVAARWAKLDPSKQNTEPSDSEHRAAPALGPETSPVAPTLDKGWCGGHGVPESVCTRCNSSLISEFKNAGDWCAEHGLPESQCTSCHPEVAARWEALNPAIEKGGAGGGAAPDSGADARAPSDPSKWCFEHGVPDAVCTRCNAALIPKFKVENDWCAEHGLPESQCTLCHPEVRQKWAALRPESDPRTGATASDLKLERVPRLLTATSDPLCQVDSLRVRFLDPTVVSKSGIEVEAVRPRRISAAIDVPAEVEFDATRVTRITPRVAGVVQEVTAEIGDTVAAGDLLAVIDSPTLGEAKSRYIERKQTYRLAEADLERVRTIYQGQQRMLEAVKAGATTEEIRQRLEGVPVGEAKARLLRAHAELQLARAQEIREAKLLDKQISSERDYEFAQSELAAAEAAFLAIREEIAFSSEREQIAAERAWQTARTALEAGERQLHILGLSDEQVQAIGTEQDTQLSRYELHSPVSGRIVELGVATGEAVEASDVLFVVADNSTMWLVADVYERDLLLLREGAPVLFTVDGLPGLSFEGRLNWISSQVDDRTRTVRVRADLPNDDRLLRAKMFGLARLIVHDDENVLSVASNAVQTDGCCQLVFVQEDETVFAPRKVVLGARANGHVEVLKGLDEGELVATTGSFLMKTEILKGNIGAGCCEVDPGR